MNQDDRYWCWLQKAVATPNIDSPVYYYYDKEMNALFAVEKKNGEYFPVVFNRHLGLSPDLKLLFRQEIFRLENEHIALVSLPKLELRKKRSFLLEFVLSISPENNEEYQLKKKMLNDVEHFSERNEFGFSFNLRTENRKFYNDYEKVLWPFIERVVNEMVIPIGVSDKSILIW